MSVPAGSFSSVTSVFPASLEVPSVSSEVLSASPKMPSPSLEASLSTVVCVLSATVPSASVFVFPQPAAISIAARNKPLNI